MRISFPFHIDLESNETIVKMLSDLTEIKRTLKALEKQGVRLMAQGDQTQQALAQIDAITTQMATVVEQVAQNEINQTSLIAQLRAEVANNATASALLDQLDASSSQRVAALQAVAQTLTPLATDPTNPVPNPNPDIPPVDGGGGEGGGTGGGTGGEGGGEV